MSWVKDEGFHKPNQLLQLFNLRDSVQEEKRSILPSHLLKHSKKKASAILYDEVYRDAAESKQSQMFKKRPPMYEVKDQNNQCWQCQTKISNGFLSIGANCEICMFNGRYYCKDCMSIVRMPVPWLAVELFDLKHYKVSKQAQLEIEQKMEVPLLEIASDSNLLVQNKSLFEFMVLKRQLHLMYDMICDPKLMQALLAKRMNLCLKKNLFSLKDLYEVYNGSLIRVIQGYYAILYKHIDLCKSCQKRGHICNICKVMIPIHPFDIPNVTYCEACLKVYHRACLDRENCPHCVENK